MFRVKENKNLIFNYHYMNTKTDNYIDSLTPWDIVQFDWTLHAIVRITPHNCYINIDWEIVEVEWSDISEEYELSVLEEKQDYINNN
jgi:hypothetical protein